MKIAFNTAIALLIAFIIAPLLIVILVSFSGREIPEFPPSTWSLRWYGHALSEPVFVTSAINSAWLAVTATCISTPIALGAAMAIVRGQFPGKNLLQAALLSPLFVPAIVTSLAILLAFSSMGLRTVTLRLVAAHVLITLPYLVRTILASLTTFLVVIVLYMFGGEGVHLFAFVMVIGVIVGTLSSIYVASPLLLIFGEGRVRGPGHEPTPVPASQPA